MTAQQDAGNAFRAAHHQDIDDYNVIIGAGTLLGTGDSDYIVASTVDDLVFSYGGNDYVDLNPEDDIGNGGLGQDQLVGDHGNDWLIGAEGDDFLVGGSGSDTLQGGVGNDLLLADWKSSGNSYSGHIGAATATFADSSSDVTVDLRVANVLNDLGWANSASLGHDRLGGMTSVYGGRYQDQIWGNYLSNFFSGQDGHDTIHGDYGNDTIWGDSGNDILWGNGDHDELRGYIGNDDLNGQDGNDRLFGEAGIDRLFADVGNDYAEGGGDRDSIYGFWGDDHLFGGDGDDWIIGEQNNDLLGGNVGNDFVGGGDGEDLLYGDQGNDTVYCDPGNDTSDGGEGDDQLYGWTGNDYLYGSHGIDRLIGEDGNDHLAGWFGPDYLSGGAGNDFEVGEGDNDNMDGGSGFDTLGGGGGNDSVYAGEDDDRLYGDAGNDYLYGSSGNDLIVGDIGNDSLDGASGVDSMHGGQGDDRYSVWEATDKIFENANEGIDTVTTRINLVLGAHVENLILSSVPVALNGTGNGINNRITGNYKSNVLNGATGIDTMMGGNGGDFFTFTTALGPTNVDTITDFSVAQDTIRLSSAIFTTAGAPGTLLPGMFRAGDAAVDATDRIIYNGKGALFYDRDGHGAAAQMQFAQLKAGLALTNADFVIF